YDMITCTGRQRDALSDIKNLVENFPSNHLSVYALTLEKGTELYRRGIRLPDDDLQAEILSAIWEYLEKSGFEHYEVSNFAKPGFRSLHNSVYWNYRQYIGIGPASASTCFKNGKVTRIECPPDVKAYVASQTYRLTELTSREALEECVIMGLRHSEGLDLDRLRDDFGFEIPFVPDGYTVSENHLIPSDTGFMTADSAAMNLF
ncbi:MAG: hypothetical protein MJ052_04550, partial [Sphaerochaetaceae bacterium]|nr:hypothetical protein [Sphaerochaetaceae bacterium]